MEAIAGPVADLFLFVIAVLNQPAEVSFDNSTVVHFAATKSRVILLPETAEQKIEIVLKPLMQVQNAFIKGAGYRIVIALKIDLIWKVTPVLTNF